MTQEQTVPDGFALVPVRPNAEMERLMQTEGWAWEDLLAAAEAITEEQYSDIATRSHIQPAASEADPWHDAILAECMRIEGAYQKDDPVKTVASLIDWHVKNASEAGAVPEKPARGLIQEIANLIDGALRKRSLDEVQRVLQEIFILTQLSDLSDADPLAEPLFWYRPVGQDGLYEGPIHNASIEIARKQSDGWVPLFPAAPPSAPAAESAEPGEYALRAGGVMVRIDQPTAATADAAPTKSRYELEETTSVGEIVEWARAVLSPAFRDIVQTREKKIAEAIWSAAATADAIPTDNKITISPDAPSLTFATADVQQEIRCPKCELEVLANCDPDGRWGHCPLPKAHTRGTRLNLIEQFDHSLPLSEPKADAQGDERAAEFKRLLTTYGWRCESYGEHAAGTARDSVIEAYRALSRQPSATADPTDPGHDVGILREHVRHLERRVRQLSQPSAAASAHTDLLAYVLQDDVHNRLTPRVIDIAYTAFMQAKRLNNEDGGASDWFTDTKPIVMRAIDKLRKDLFEDRAALAAAKQGDSDA